MEMPSLWLDYNEGRTSQQMTLQIWKYPLKDTWQQELLMPKGANIIHVGEQRGVICLWAEIDTKYIDLNKHVFYLVGTGNEWPPVQVRHIGTVIKKEGRFVWHVYQEVPPSYP